MNQTSHRLGSARFGAVQPVKQKKGLKQAHPAPFPEELPFRLIQLYSFKDNIILDPFMGSGTAAAAALKSGRKFVGYDIKQEYIDLAEKRISQLLIRIS